MINHGHALINSHLDLVADRNSPGVDSLVSAMVKYIKSTVQPTLCFRLQFKLTTATGPVMTGHVENALEKVHQING